MSAMTPTPEQVHEMMQQATTLAYQSVAEAVAPIGWEIDEPADHDAEQGSA